MLIGLFFNLFFFRHIFAWFHAVDWAVSFYRTLNILYQPIRSNCLCCLKYSRISASAAVAK